MKTKKGDCRKCNGMCCRYFGVPIETPENAADFDDIRWYMLHKGTEVYVEDGDWYLNVQNVCRYLGPDNSCGIYETRPKICRGYSTDNCEITSDEYQHEQHFYSSDHLEAYARDFLRNKRRHAQLKARRKRLRAGSNGRKAK